MQPPDILPLSLDLLDRISDAVFALDTDWRYSYVNRAAAAALGCPPADLIGRDVRELFPEIVDTPLFAEAAAALREGTPRRVETFHPRPGRWYESDLYPDTTGLTVISRDITDRHDHAEQQRQRDAEVQAATARLRQAVETMQGFVYDLDLATRRVWRSHGMARVVGFDPGSVPETAQWWRDRCHPEDSIGIDQIYQRIFETGAYSREYRVRHRDGHWVWVWDRATVVYDDAGRPARMLGTTVDISERKQIEETLRRQAELLDLTYDAVFVHDLHGAITYWNKGAEALYGWSAAEAVGRVSHDLLHTMFPPLPLPVDELLARNGYWEGELTHIDHRGARVTVDSRQVLLRDDTGRPAAILETNRDVTARRAAEIALTENLALLDTLIENAPVAIAFVDRDFRYVRVNISGAAMGGRTPDELLGRTVEEISPLLWPAIEPFYRQVRDEGRSIVGVEVTGVAAPSGEPGTYLASYYPVRNAAGEVLGVGLIVVDVTTERAAEAAVRESEEFARSIFESSPDCVKVIDLDGRLVTMNGPGMCLMEIDDFEPFRLKPWVELWPAASRGDVLAAIEAALAGGTGQFVAFCPTAKGTPKWWDVLVAPVRDSTDRPVRLVSISRDITERMQAEAERERLLEKEQAARAEAEAAVAARDAVVAVISHDLKSPLATIRGYAQMGQRLAHRSTPPPLDQITTALAAIEGETGRMSGMLGDLLDAALLQSGRTLDLVRVPVDLVALTERCVAAHARTTDRHIFQVRREAGTLTGEWDEARIGRVIDNLLNNALKYSPEGGAIEVRLDEDADSGDRWAVFAITDHGIGIPAADLPHVFERFRRGGNVAGRIAGTGIGLAGVRQIVEQHGGSVTIDSTEGQGTTVTIRLPAGPRPDTAGSGE
jgi:PAS domain S-box-containing protein